MSTDSGNQRRSASPEASNLSGESSRSSSHRRKEEKVSPTRSSSSSQFKQRGRQIQAQALHLASSLSESVTEFDPSTLPPDAKVVEICSEMAVGARYIVSGALRKVPPYYYTYLTYCKMRWRDRKLIDVFTTEFRDRDEIYYVSYNESGGSTRYFHKKWAIEQGKVFLNGKPANLDSIVRNGDSINHRTHKHEPAVTSRPIKIVFQDDEIVVIDKPSGIPVHPTGRYRYNTVVEVLKHEHGINVHPCNRLDRLTSGLMFLARNPKSADKISSQLRGREVSKKYLARVVGEFPLGVIVCEEPLLTVDPRVTLNRVHPDGKEAKTIFKRVSYDGETSMVLCSPLTGRTHQIRVHLQYMGYPIANDPIYSNKQVWGDELGKFGAGDNEDIIARLDKIGKTESAQSYMFTGNGEHLTGEKCAECRTDLYTDPGPNDLDLWLHAMTYEANDGSWKYKTELPDWATEVHMPFMKLALEEAKKCGPTETAFSVGALLVKDGKILETGYSRELPGNTHAEQCALEKYFAKNNVDDVPEGTVIYTTMEPCSLRLSGNLPCVDRIVKTSIKTVFVGVVEPQTFVEKNVGLEKLQEQGVEYMHIAGLEDECLKAARKGHPTEGDLA